MISMITEIIRKNYFDMRLVTFFGTSRQLWGGGNFIYYKKLLIRVESVYVLYFVWASQSRKIPLSGHGPYRHCEQNPKNSMQIQIIVRVCKFNCFFQRLIRILFLKPCTEHFPSFHFV